MEGERKRDREIEKIKRLRELNETVIGGVLAVNHILHTTKKAIDDCL
jgi:hypothetical protein